MKIVVLKDIFKYSAIALFLSTTLTACGSDDGPIDTPVVEDGTGDSGSDDSGSGDSGSDNSGSDNSGSDDSGSGDSGSDDSGSGDSGSDGSSSNGSGSNDSGSDDSGSDDSGSNDSGSDDSGSDDSGSDDSGSDDSGSDGSGSDDSGSDDSGSDDSGSDDSGSDDSGSDDSGSDDSGSDNSGSDDSGSDNSGSDDDSADTTEPVGDTTSPVITLNNDAYIKIRTITNASVYYTDSGATATDDVDGNLDPYIYVSGAEFVDLLAPGSYPITYNVSDAAGNQAEEVTRTVRVANYGDKDTSLNSSGVKYTDVAYDIGKKVLQDSSGNIYAIGTNDSSSVFVRKYTSAGAVDTTYGISGTVSYVQSGASSETVDAMIDGSDNLFVAVRNWASVDTIQIIKVKPDATLDSSFGTDGVAEVDLPTSYSDVSAMSVDSQGNFFVLGSNYDGTPAPFVTKFNATGSLDTNFGTNGIYAMPVTVSTYTSDIVVTSNDNLALVGYELGSDNQWTMKVWQVSASGALDTNFGDNGVVTYNGGNYTNGTFGKSITVDSEGNIIAAGEGARSASQRDAIVMKLANDGSFDPDFPTTTKLANVNTAVEYAVRDVAVGDDGIIYIAGGAGTTASENAQDRGYVVAFRATGTPASFGAGSGVAQYDMIPNKRDNFISLLLDETSNHILVMGYAYKDNTIEDTAFVLKLQN
ncbi:MAG: immunoglobulin-like domain-containing protein [Paraglaciecola sp.]|uniref:immunoglobulin-like domain-containing protein n=1 Tax=Paraglaciecola sp. TaxID=1920173 RepID=UPI003298B471